MQQPTSVRLITRTLGLFKVLIGISLLVVPVLIIVAIIERSWPSILLASGWAVMGYHVFRGMRQLRTVMWEEDQLLVKDQVDVIIPLAEIESVNLKRLMEYTGCD